jgi:hypothetical protein
MSELTISEASRTFDVHPNILSRLVLGGRLVARKTKMVDSTLKAAGVEPLRDGSYGEKFLEAANWLDIQEVLTAPQSPSQNSYVERLIGSIRRECLDHVIVLNETGLPYSEKESNSLDAVEDGLFHSERSVYTEYADPKRTEWITKI